MVSAVAGTVVMVVQSQLSRTCPVLGRMLFLVLDLFLFFELSRFWTNGPAPNTNSRWGEETETAVELLGY